MNYKDLLIKTQTALGRHELYESGSLEIIIDRVINDNIDSAELLQCLRILRNSIAGSQENAQLYGEKKLLTVLLMQLKVIAFREIFHNVNDDDNNNDSDDDEDDDDNNNNNNNNNTIQNHDINDRAIVLTICQLFANYPSCSFLASIDTVNSISVSGCSDSIIASRKMKCKSGEVAITACIYNCIRSEYRHSISGNNDSSTLI